jgi:FixJ family two-component response regulator
VTAVLDEQIRKQVLKAGAIDILSKPFSDERLASCLVSALNGFMNTLPSLAGMPSLGLK